MDVQPDGMRRERTSGFVTRVAIEAKRWRAALWFAST